MNKNRWLPIATISFTLMGGSFLLVGCNDQGNMRGQMPPQTVEVVVAKPQALEMTRTLPARVSAYRVAEIRPQVNGTILKREFVEGSDVKVGQSLYLIDPATYQAAYNSAQANLASAQAAAEVSRLTLNRYRSLLGSSAISRQDYDQAVASAAAADAQVLVAQAALDNAEINLNYTKVYSPIDGRVATSNVTEGALVAVGQPTALTTVQQLDPIYVDMTQSAAELLRMNQELKDGTLEQKDGKAVVKLILENGQEYPYEGTLEFSGVTVNQTTGTVALRAIFPNPKPAENLDPVLLPGMFVRAVLTEGTKNNVFLIPQKAVARDAKGATSVKVVDENNIIVTKQVQAVKAIGSDWVITQGINDGDRIVTSGLQKIADGAPVTIKQDQPTQISGESPASAAS